MKKLKSKMKQAICMTAMMCTMFTMTACAQETGNPTGLSTRQAGQTDEMKQEDDADGGEKTGVFNLEAKTVMLNSGYRMPLMGLGTYSLDYDTCVASVTALLEKGGRLIDTAYMYHNEDAVGAAVRASGVPREEIFVTTKLYPNQYNDAAQAIDDALEKMGLEYIDLMLLHHPGTGDAEAYRAMEAAVADGKIRSIGLSKMEYGFNCVSCA